MFLKKMKEQVEAIYKILKMDIPYINSSIGGLRSINENLEFQKSWLKGIEERYDNLIKQNRELLDYIMQSGDNKFFIYNGEKFIVSRVVCKDDFDRQEPKTIDVEMSKID